VANHHATVFPSFTSSRWPSTGFSATETFEPFVADTMLCCPEPTIDRVKLTTIGITSVEIPDSTRFTLVLLKIQHYMWRITTPHPLVTNTTFQLRNTSQTKLGACQNGQKFFVHMEVHLCTQILLLILSMQKSLWKSQLEFYGSKQVASA